MTGSGGFYLSSALYVHGLDLLPEVLGAEHPVPVFIEALDEGAELLLEGDEALSPQDPLDLHYG
jgi:hypothetical protein